MVRSIPNWSDKPSFINVSDMNTLYHELLQLTPRQISRKYSVPLERADIITPASSIFLRIANIIKATEIAVPDIGVRNGIIAELYHGLSK